jgi:hypothetical protein
MEENITLRPVATCEASGLGFDLLQQEQAVA